MKDHFKFGHLITLGTVQLNNNQVIDLETKFQIHTNVTNFETAPPNPYELSNFFSCLLNVSYMM